MYVGNDNPAEQQHDSPMQYLFTPDKELLTSVSLPPVKKKIMPASAPVSRSVSADNSKTAESQEKAGAEVREASFYPPYFISALQAAIKAAAERKTPGSLLFLSFDNLAMIISACGHDASEKIVHDIMAQLSVVLGDRGSLYRLHRDQLGLILNIADHEEVEAFASQAGELINNYGMDASIGSLHVICSIGSVLFPKDGGTPQSAIDNAYVALHNTRGLLHRAFEDAQIEIDSSRQQMGLANYLRKAMQNNSLRLSYQPIIESASGRITHYEALLRVIGKDGKLSSAGPLIPVAERMGLIDDIDRMVLEMVVKELEQAANVILAFNVSNLTTDNAAWLDHCRSLLQDKPEIASRIIVEITETAAQQDLRSTAYFVACLQEMGCQVALDDFGSGYTSFRQLKALSVDMVKIDGAFIRDLADNSDNRFFVKTLLDFTNGFGLKAVAEYVENGETAKMLMQLGVQYMQGYYFAKPQNFRGWLNEGEYSPS